MEPVLELLSGRVDDSGGDLSHLGPVHLPSPVDKLPRREREVAAIVYASGGTSAKDVCAALSVELSNGAVRSMLGRLVAKGVLIRRPSGKGKTFLYVPAISSDLAIEHAFQTFANDFFEGSCERALAKLDSLFALRHDKVIAQMRAS